MQPELSIVMPCLNEARTLALCIAKAQAFLKEHDIAGEIIVADNGSRDGSVELANRMGARVVTVETRGYGAALAGGIEAAQGKYVIIDWFLEQRRTLEWCIAVGMGSIVAGVVLGIMAARQWSLVGFGGLEAVWILRLVICSVLFLLLGGQTLLAGFYFGLMNLVAERRTRQLSSSADATKSIRKTNEGAG